MIERYLQAGLRLFYKSNLAPLYIIHFITNKCNANCQHCFYRKELNINKQLLSVEEIDKMTKKLGKLLYINLTGGEPFLREDIVTIAQIYYKNTKPLNIVIPTNGILTNKIVSDVKKILKLCPRSRLSVRFSIDNTEALHNKIRGVEAFKHMLTTYEILNQLKREGHKNLDLGFITTISSFNQDYLDELFEFMKHNLKGNNWRILFARNIGEKGADIQKYNLFANKVNNYFGRGIIDNLVSKIITYNKYVIPCYAGRTSCVITEDGEIKPCEPLNYSFGNIKSFNYDFKKLWNNQKAKSFRKKVIKNKCFCSHECFVSNNVVFNLKMFTKIIKNYIFKGALGELK
ncbi:MAG: radical SAM protein [Nanoarchaeota archaeon]